VSTNDESTSWELSAETIAIKIRWIGLVLGYAWVNLQPTAHVLVLNAILGLGLFYALVDTYYSFLSKVYLARYPLIVAVMEALFIGLLCFFDTGLQSPFRFYYILSLVVCAIRHSSWITYSTCGLHCASVLTLEYASAVKNWYASEVLLVLIVLFWFTWASSSLAAILKEVGEGLRQANGALKVEQGKLESRIAERTRELHDTQAHLLHQEKMAAFGLLAAGIAHEVGNPLTSISYLVQMLQRRVPDSYAQEKLTLVGEQLNRIQAILRELIDFSRPAATEKLWVSVGDIVREALNIAKYYKRTGKTMETAIPEELPQIYVVKDQMVQAVLNLVLNAIDATEKNGRIVVAARLTNEGVRLSILDNGHGIDPESQKRLMQAYFTTKTHGTGLGLFVTQKLVTDHGGRVEFESEPGRTVFHIELPRSGPENRQGYSASGLD
jgi:signal transduction histidine kinase